MAEIPKLANELVTEVKRGLEELAHNEKKATRDIKAAEHIIPVLEKAIVGHLKDMIKIFDSDVSSAIRHLRADPFQKPNYQATMGAFLTNLNHNISLFDGASIIMLNSSDPGLKAAGDILKGLKLRLIEYRNPFISAPEMQIFSNASQARTQLINYLGEFARQVINALEQEKKVLHQKEQLQPAA
jgi:hypothetical protein